MNTVDPPLQGSHIPWFRKNWFVLVSAFIVPPIAIVILLTGNVYYKKNGELSTYSGTLKIVNLVIAVALTVLWVGRILGMAHSDTHVISSVPVPSSPQEGPAATPAPAPAAVMAESAPAAKGISEKDILTAQLNDLDKRIQVAGAKCVQGDSDGCDEVNSLKLERLALTQTPEYKMAVLGAVMDAVSEGPKDDGPKASFDCSKASNYAEKTVCQDPGLANTDVTLANQYKIALASAGERAEDVRKSERTFIDVRNKCSNEDCVAQAYNGQLAIINVFLEKLNHQ